MKLTEFEQILSKLKERNPDVMQMELVRCAQYMIEELEGTTFEEKELKLTEKLKEELNNGTSRYY